jgi:hypothetical protein
MILGAEADETNVPGCFFVDWAPHSAIQAYLSHTACLLSLAGGAPPQQPFTDPFPKRPFTQPSTC